MKILAATMVCLGMMAAAYKVSGDNGQEAGWFKSERVAPAVGEKEKVA